MDELFRKQDLISAAHLDKLRLEMTAGLLMRLLNVNKLNQMYSDINHKKGVDFVEAALSSLKVRYAHGENDLENIPKTGPFVIVANHPFGMLDGLVLLDIVARIRPDVKIVANLLMSRIEEIKDFFIPINPFEEAGEDNHVAGVKNTLEYLRDGHPVIMFPAGEVSGFQPEQGEVTDREWKKGAIKLIKKANVPVLPVYFHGSQNMLFRLVNALAPPALRDVQVPVNLFKKDGARIRLRIGKTITIKEQSDYPTTEELCRHLRARTYALGAKMEATKSFISNIPERLTGPIEPQPIVNPIASEVLFAELSELTPIHTQKNFALYIEKADDIPNVIQEIGRLREITFREVGEGTNKSTDLDEFDTYYYHLVMWDFEAKKVVGAYRLGMGGEILERFGKKGFYVQTVFKMDNEMLPILRQAIELGRSFIVKEYQRNPLPLFMLWRGILYFLLRNPQYRYLIGPVSISNDYSMVSKSLLIAYIKKFHFNHELAQYVHPRKEFKVKTKSVDVDALVSKGDDMNRLDKLISDIEPSSYKVPVLVKKYIKQNAKLLAFNVDPAFNDCLDGLILLNLNDVPEDMIENLKKEMNL